MRGLPRVRASRGRSFGRARGELFVAGEERLVGWGVDHRGARRRANDPEPWPRPPNQMALAVKAGLVPETAEQLEYHVHSHLDVYVNGQHIIVPAGLGIDITNPGVHNGHVTDGHTALRRHQPAVRRAVHLAAAHARRQRRPAHRVVDAEGQHARPVLHRVGRQPLDGDLRRDVLQVTGDADHVLRERRSSRPVIRRTIPLSNLKEIAIVIGTPPPEIPTSFDLSQI